MPTTKPRISITLEESDLAVLDRFAAASRTPRASVIAQMIASVTPELERAAGLMEAATAAGPGVLARMRQDIKDANDAAGGAELEAAHEAYRLMIRKVSHRVEYGPPGGKRATGLGDAHASPLPGARKRPGPPSTNRGVKT